MKNRVFVAGRYGFQSFGDDVILAAIVSAFRTVRPDLEIECASATPDETASEFAVKAILWSDSLAVSESIRRSDLVIVGGGGLFHDHWDTDAGSFLTSDNAGVADYTAPAILGALYGKPVFLYAVGIGPLETRQAQLFTRAACQAAAVISVRDAASKRLLKSVGADVTKVQVTADAAFGFEVPKSLEKHSAMSIAVAARPWETGVIPAFWESELASALDRFVTEHGGTVNLIPCERKAPAADDDRRAAERIRGRMKHGRSAEIVTVTRPSEIYRVLSASDVVIGMRLHALILGALAGTPVIGLSHESKNRELFRQLGVQENFVDLTSIDGRTLGRLIDDSLASRDRFGGIIAGKVRRLRALAISNARRAIDLLDGGIESPVPFTAEMREVLGRGLQATLRENRVLRSELQQAGAEIRGGAESIENGVAPAEALPMGRESEGLSSEEAQAQASTREPGAAPDIVGGLASREAGDLFKAATRAQKYDFVVFAIFEFDFRFQRPQQIALALARRGHRVFWISPLRTIPPSHQRGFEAVPLGERIWEVHLRERHDLYQGELSPSAARLAFQCLRELYQDFAIAESCSLVQFPYWRQVGMLLRQELHARVVYDCMDDWQNWTAYPGIGDFSLSEERKLDEQADVVVVSSEEYRRRRAARNLPSVVIRNGVDFEFFSEAARGDITRQLQGPVVGYFGALADWFDAELVASVAAARPGYSFVLIGEASAAVRSALSGHPNIHLLGEKSHGEIPAYLTQFDVCLIPFLLNDFTKGVDPVKLYEYLSQGKPVVATALPELPMDSGLLYIGRDTDDFTAKVDAALKENDADLRSQRIEFARKNTWADRAEVLEKAIARVFPRVSILIVTYQSEEFIGLCLSAICQNTAWPNYEVLVVDNASTDETPRITQKYAQRDDRVRLLALERNTGFSGGNNAAAREASGDYLVFLNADTVVTPGWLERLIRHCYLDPGIGQVAAVTNFSGNETKINVSYSNATEMLEFASEVATSRAGQSIEVGVAPLYCVLMPRPVWQLVGELDEKFRIGTFEDDDLSLRVLRAGYRVVVADDAFVHHFGNGSFGKLTEEENTRIFSENQQYYQVKWNQPPPRHQRRPGVRSPYEEPRHTPAEFVRSLSLPDLSLKALHPQTARAGEGFNLQPDQQSALGVTCANATPGTVIVIDGMPLSTTYGSPTALSALVPAEVTGRAGRHRVCLRDAGTESNGLELVLTGDTSRPQPGIATEGLPLVSCVMPTADRRAFVPRAIRQFLQQDYPNRELVVVDAGRFSIADLVPVHPRIRVVRANSELPLGTLRNVGCRAARGEYIAHWDDDDWIASWRLSYQLQALVETQSDVCGIDRMIYWDPVRNQSWRYTYPRNERPWLAGGSLLYRRDFWERQPFQEIDVGEDNLFVWSDVPKRMAHLDHEDFYIALLHSGNTSPKIIDDSRWIPIDPKPIIAALGPEAIECRNLVLQHESAGKASVREPQRAAPMRFRSHEVGSFAVARRRDLELPEFFAMVQEYPVPRVYHWEFPYALFQAHLRQGMEVLDCTIESAQFDKPIGDLYAGVKYCHSEPFDRGDAGLPEKNFDRIFCRHTLEKLSAAQRSLLISEMASKLKPGGRLVLTWAHALDSGQAPADIANLCTACGLVAGGAIPDAPDGSDEELHVDQQPAPHATVGAVFGKPGTATPAVRVVLALLTWNTRNVSLDSLAALCNEARMLERAGNEAAICVVDNGSTDGTAEAVRDLDAGFGLAHRFILNESNAGSSRARNQMIDYMMEWGADYILFVDGDIEVVPCSSFAMLRHMERSGTRLGCLGAYSAHCTAERQNATPTLFSMAHCRLYRSEVLAWTQYGMFRRALFEDGIRFDESGPFGEAGHGLEDVDFALQMVEKGYGNEYFEGIRYLHRNLSSSVEILRGQGVNPTVQYYRRKEHLLKKWEALKGLREDSMEWVRNARAPWPEDVSLPGLGELRAVSPALLRLAEEFASAMINAPDLAALAAVLATFAWSGKELVVEIGAYVGLTTVFIAKVLDALGIRASVIAIDPFDRCTPDMLNPRGNYAQFVRNIQTHGVEDRCIPIAAFSADAAPTIPDRVGVLFIDGSHHYESVRADLELYVPKVVPGGFVYVHDYFDAYPGVIRAVDEFTAGRPELVRIYEGTYVLFRVSPHA
jgi:polysaccharide pyruvyl transferase CsaB